MDGKTEGHRVTCQKTERNSAKSKIHTHLWSPQILSFLPIEVEYTSMMKKRKEKEVHTPGHTVNLVRQL